MYSDNRYTPKTEKAIREFGKEVCLEAYRLNRAEGEGCTMIADQFACLDSNRIKANDAINAGHEITEGAEPITVRELRAMLFEIEDQDAPVIFRLKFEDKEMYEKQYCEAIAADYSKKLKSVVIYANS
jgi:hypothetical protein